MNARKWVIVVILLSCVRYTAESQDTNLARIEYTYMPYFKNSNAYSRYRVAANYPIKMNDKGSYLVMSFEYRFNNLDTEDIFTMDDVPAIGNFQTYGFEVGYTFRMKNDWRFGAKLGLKISSNFESLRIDTDDYIYTGAAYFIKNYGSKKALIRSRLVLGLKYTTPASINYPLPIINYFKKFHPNWSYSLGTPKTSMKCTFDKKNTLQAFVGLDQFYGNIQNNRVFMNKNGITEVAENASMLIVNSALGYEHFFTEHILFYVYAGYTLSNEIRLRDATREDVLVISDKNTIYIRNGIKLKI